MQNKNYYILTVGLIIAALILGGFFYQAVKNQNTIKVVGISKKAFTADKLKWALTFETKADQDQLEQGYLEMQKKLSDFKKEIKNVGIETEQFNVQPITVNKEFNYITKNGNSQRVFTGYKLKQYLFLITEDIEAVEDLVLDPLKLYNKDIIIAASNLEYFYYEIDELKKEILAEATVNAQTRAEKMLANTNLKIDKVISMNSGVFQITEPYSTNTSSLGVYNTSSKNKEISVTAHTTFSIK